MIKLIDASGSMAGYHERTRTRLSVDDHIILFDDRYYDLGEITDASTLSTIELCTMGGSSLAPVFEYIDTNYPNEEIVIYTDGTIYDADLVAGQYPNVKVQEIVPVGNYIPEFIEALKKVLIK